MLIQIKADEQACIIPLLKERVDELGVETRLDFQYVETLLALNLASNSCSVFTDDKDDPSCLLILTSGRMTIFPEETTFTNVIHVKAEVREKDPTRSLALGKKMLTMAEAYSKQKGAEVLRISSWVYRGRKDIGSLFESHGFELQSMEYIKTINPGPRTKQPE